MSGGTILLAASDVEPTARSTAGNIHRKRTREDVAITGPSQRGALSKKLNSSSTGEELVRRCDVEIILV